MLTGSHIRCVTWNINGCGSPIKRRKVLSYLKQKQADIAFIQESHVRDTEALKFKREWVGHVFHSSFSSKQNGVVILINKHLNFNIISETKDKEGRMICIEALINGVKVILCSVYAPNTADASFIHNLNTILGSKSGQIILAGDWNQVMDGCLDKSKYQGTSMPKDRAALHMLVEDLGLNDIWRLVNPKEREYTFFSHAHKSHSRIDFFLLSQDITNKVINCKIGPIALSDHATVELDINLNPDTGRKGRWRLNTSLLQDEVFSTMLAEDLISFFDLNIGSTERLSSVWDASKAYIRGKLIARASKMKKERREILSDLEMKICALEKNLARQYSDELYQEICKYKYQLHDLYNAKAEHALFRLRTRFYEGGEKTGKLLSRQLKQQNAANIIPAIKKGDNMVSTTKEINSVFQTFYEQLYTAPCNADEEKVNQFFASMNLPTLDASQTKALDQPITEEEVRNAISSMKLGKSPGSDGLPIEYYKKFVDTLAPILTDVIAEAFQVNSLPDSFMEAIITLLPKKDRDTTEPANFRPVSLLNVDCKILAKVLASRLEKVLPKIIHKDQVGFIKGRSSADNTRRLMHLMWLNYSESTPGAALSLDAQTAFDLVQWNFLFKTMTNFGLGKVFRAWVNLLYQNPRAAVITNGMMSPFFTVSRGTRQGCPLSPLLFTMVLEPLAIKIREDPNILGLKGVDKETEQKLMLYADDILLLMSEPATSLPLLMEVIESYSVVSGYKINWRKSEAMPITRTCYSHMVTGFGFKWVPSGMKYLGVRLTQNLEGIMALNYDPLLTKIQHNVEKWKHLKLTLWGKVNVVKMVVAPQFNYISMMLPLNIPDIIFKRYDNIVKDFLWEGKRPRIKMSKMCALKDKGGLGLPDVKMYDLSFEMAQLAKHWRNTDSDLDWVTFEQSLASPCKPLDILSQRSGLTQESNPVIEHSRYVWCKIHKLLKLSHYRQSYASLWNNPDIRIGKKMVFWKQWLLKGIATVKDLYVDGQVMSYSDLMGKYNIEGRGHFWKYLQIRHCVGDKFNFNENPVLTYFQQPHIAHTASVCYNLIINATSDNCCSLKLIWQRDLGVDFDEGEWSKIMANVGKNIREARGKFIHYKVVHRYYYTPSRLYRMGIAENGLCWKCKETDGTFLHMLWECSYVHPFWCKILGILEEWLGFSLPADPRLCLLGDKSVVPSISKHAFTVVKLCCITTLRIILRNWKCVKTLELKDWVNAVIEAASYESMLERLNDEKRMIWNDFWVHMKMT